MTQNFQVEEFPADFRVNQQWVEEQPHDRHWMLRMVWLIAGFNVGFIMPTVIIFVVLPMFASDIAPRRADQEIAQANPEESSAFVVVTGIPTDTPIPSPTLEPSPTPTDLPPTATSIPVTSEVVAVLPSPTATLFPTSTPLPPTATPIPAPPAYEMSGFEFYQQTWNNCGPANLAMGLSYFQWEGDQKTTAAVLKPNREDKNVSPEQMIAYVNENTSLRAIYRVAGNFETLRWLVSQQFVVIIESGYIPPADSWYGHYRLVVGYDDNRQEFQFYDSNQPRSTPMKAQSYEAFDRDWQAFNRTYLVIYPPEREFQLRDFLGVNWNPIANWRNAADVARHEIEAEGDNPFAYFNLGTALTMIGEYSNAALAFDVARNSGALPFRMFWYQFAAFEAYFQSSRLGDVESLANITLETTPYVEEMYYYLGRVAEVQGNIEGALGQYREALEYNSNFRLAQDAINRLGG